MENETKNAEQLWMASKPAINKGGRPVLFENPVELYNKAIGYFEWVDAHPWQDKAASNGLSEVTDVNGKSRGKTNSVNQHVRALRRPYTLYGLCAYAGISSKWADFKRNYVEKDGFLEVIAWIENVITSEQVDGAMVRRYDSNLVARINCISDTIKNEITGKDGEDLRLPLLTDDDIEEIKKISRRNG